MRLIHGTIAMVTLVTLAACGTSDKPEAKPTKSVSPAPARYVTCDLLTQPERDNAAGTKVEWQNENDANFPDWSCAYGNDPAGTATVDVSYVAVRAPLWAAKLPDIVETTPSEDAKEVRSIFTAALKHAQLSEGDLADLDAATACTFWSAFQTERGADVSSGVATESFTEPISEEFAPGEDLVIALASTCVDGVYADVSVTAPDVDSDAGRKRVEETLALVHERAVAELPRSA